MAADDEDYVYDEASGEWLPAAEFASKRAADGIKGLVLRAEFVRKRCAASERVT